MLSVLYAIWLLLPLGLFLLGVWAFVKPYLGVRGREAAMPYFAQSFFCAIALAIAIAIDSSEWFVGLVQTYSFDWFNLSIARWLLYPAVLAALAYIQRYWKKEDQQRVSPKRFIYN